MSSLSTGPKIIPARGEDVHSGRGPRRTQMLEVFERLQTDILSVALKPGERLRLKEIRERYACGLSPLREALMRLVADGLVVMENRKGFKVAPVSREDMVDLTQTRCELEAIAIRLAIQKGDDRWESNLLARYHELSKRPMMNPDGRLDSEWETRHQAFHAAIRDACGSYWLQYFCGILFERTGRYRALSVLATGLGGGARDVTAEHEAILKAALARDTTTAEDLIRRHLTATTNLIGTTFEDPETGPSTDHT